MVREECCAEVGLVAPRVKRRARVLRDEIIVAAERCAEARGARRRRRVLHDAKRFERRGALGVGERRQFPPYRRARSPAVVRGALGHVRRRAQRVATRAAPHRSARRIRRGLRSSSSGFHASRASRSNLRGRRRRTTRRSRRAVGEAAQGRREERREKEAGGAAASRPPPRARPGTAAAGALVELVSATVAPGSIERKSSRAAARQLTTASSTPPARRPSARARASRPSSAPRPTRGNSAP